MTDWLELEAKMRDCLSQASVAPTEHLRDCLIILDRILGDVTGNGYEFSENLDFDERAKTHRLGTWKPGNRERW